MDKLSRETDFESGVVIPVNKPYGWTSFDVIRKVKFLMKGCGYKKIKIGHAGTLDPLATGILLVCIGKATKSADQLQQERKEYVAQVTLGATTPSYDMEHPVYKTYPTEHITRQMIDEVLASLIGEQLQTPPVFSAKMIDGKRAYDYARQGEEVKMKKALVNIYDIEFLGLENNILTIRVECSKGTYIRSLAHDIGIKLSSGAYLSGLVRTKSGGYTIESSYTIEDLEQILKTEKNAEN